MTDTTTEELLLVDEVYGVYVPQIFARRIKNNDYREDLSFQCDVPDFLKLAEMDPSEESYSHIWDDVLDRCTVIDAHDQEYFLFQDGNLWAIPTS